MKTFHSETSCVKANSHIPMNWAVWAEFDKENE